MKYTILFIGALVILYVYVCSCERPQKKDDSITTDICYCDESTFPFGERTDSTISISGFESDSEGKFNLNLDSLISDVLGIGLTAKTGRADKDVDFKVIAKKIEDIFPDVTKAEVVYWRFYCEYVRIVCNDTSLSDSDKRSLISEKLEQVKSEIKNKLDSKFESNILKDDNSSSVKVKKQNKTSPPTRKKDILLSLDNAMADEIIIEQLGQSTSYKPDYSESGRLSNVPIALGAITIKRVLNGKTEFKYEFDIDCANTIVRMNGRDYSKTCQ